MKPERFKNEFFLLESEPEEWQLRHYGANHRTKGDTISITMAQVMDEKIENRVEDLDWNTTAMEVCVALLNDRKRWPDKLNMSMDAKNWIHFKVNRLLYKFNMVKLEKYRPQRNMTRDPFNNTIAACAVYGRADLLNRISIPVHLYRPASWAWHRCLKDFTVVNYMKWLKRERQAGTPKPEFAKDLKRRRAMAIEYAIKG